MDIQPRFVSDPPALRTAHDDKPTLIVSWWCTMYAIAIILFRVFGRYIRTEKWYREDIIMLCSPILLLIRVALVDVILLYGTNNTVTDGLTSDEIRKRVIGSRLVLFSRVVYAAYLWTIKYSVSMFLRTLTSQVWQRAQHARILLYLHVLLAVTFLAVIIADLAECQPFDHYWQVVPDPGPQCRQGYAQLLTMGILNVITDLALVIFPLPMVIKSRLPLKGKLKIAALLALPLLSIIFTIARLPVIITFQGRQQIRTLLASVDIVLVTAAANAVVLGSLLQDKGYKKLKYKYPTQGVAVRADGKGEERTGTGKVDSLRRKQWGSDEDLMRADTAEDIDMGTRGTSRNGGEGESMEMSSLGGGDDRIRTPPKAAMAFKDIVVNTTWVVDVEDGAETEEEQKERARVPQAR